jgi:hypothetical protein
MNKENILPSSINSLSVLEELTDELMNPYKGIKQFATSILNDADVLTNTINTLISQPDYSTYVSTQENDYFNELSTYITNFINNFPTLTE